MLTTGVERELYRYYKPETRGLDFEGMLADLEVLELLRIFPQLDREVLPPCSSCGAACRGVHQDHRTSDQLRGWWC